MTTEERLARRERFSREAGYHLDRAHALGKQVDALRDDYYAAGGVKAPAEHPATVAYLGHGHGEDGTAGALIEREQAHCREADALLRAAALLAEC